MRGVLTGVVIALCSVPGGDARADKTGKYGCKPGYQPKRADRVIVNCRELSVPGVEVRNWKQKRWGTLRIRRFGDRPPRHLPRTRYRVTLHETSGYSHTSTERFFFSRRRTSAPGESALGVHFIVARDGRVTQHHDLVEELYHDRGGDGAAIGIEVVGLLPPVRRRRFRFGHRDVPTLAQMKAVEAIVTWLVDPKAGHGLGIPATFSGVRGTAMTVDEIDSPALPRTGIWTHQHIVDRRWDGIVPQLYVWMRRNCAAASPKAAYVHVLRLANAAGRRWRGKKSLVLSCPH